MTPTTRIHSDHSWPWFIHAFTRSPFNNTWQVPSGPSLRFRSQRRKEHTAEGKTCTQKCSRLSETLKYLPMI